ncbi:unnamed protein product [Schistosoma turkestanicum]|nr:unnamed protein product [Schistosoma turkestanicum]
MCMELYRMVTNSKNNSQVGNAILNAYNFWNIRPKVWIASLISIFVISAVGLLGVGVVPLVQKVFFNQVIQYLVALAVGTLTGDAMLHLLPHAVSGGEGHGHGNEGASSDEGDGERTAIMKGLVALGGVYFFFMAEKILSLTSEYRAEKKLEKEDRERALLNLPVAPGTRRLSSVRPSLVPGGLLTVPGQPRRLSQFDPTVCRRASRAMSIANEDVVLTGLSSKAMKSIDILYSYAEEYDELTKSSQDNDVNQPLLKHELQLSVPDGKSKPTDEMDPSKQRDVHHQQQQQQPENLTINVPKIKIADEANEMKETDNKTEEKPTETDKQVRSIDLILFKLFGIFYLENSLTNQVLSKIFECIIPNVQYNHKDGTVVTKRLSSNILSSQPVTWSVSENGRYLIGHMILQKKTDPHFGEPGLGLKLAGGRLNKSGRLSAFITQIKPGSPADIIGHLKSGDEILEWNGQSLRGLNADDVSQIIYQSKDKLQVELLAQRELNESDNTPTDNVVLMVPNRSDCLNSNEIDSVECNVKSSLHLKLFYDEIKHQLIVNILEARNLPNINKLSRVPCNFYCRLCLLPEQVQYNSRCTKLVSCHGINTNPVWNQIFRFTNFTDNDLNKLNLEITIWNCNEYLDEQYKIGEVVIDLSVADLLDVGYWYPIRSFHRFFSTSELSNMNPDVNTTPYDVQSYTSQVPKKSIKSRYQELEQQPQQQPQQWSPKSMYRNPDMSDDNAKKLKSIRDDYCDIDEQKIATSIRQNRKFTSHEYQREGDETHHPHRHCGSRLHPSAQNFEYGGQEENAIQSDASEFSDLSELSRMSLHTSQSDRQRMESMQTSRKGSQQFDVLATQSSHERHARNLQKPDRLEQTFLPSVEQSTRARRDSSRIDKDISVPIEDEERHEIISKDNRNFESDSGQRISSADSDAESRASRSLIENKVSNFEIAQNVQRDPTDGRKRRPNIGQKFSNVLGRSNKSSSTSTLDKKSRTSFQRSEEVLPFGGGYGAVIFEGQEQDGSYNYGRLSMMHCQSSIGSGKSDSRNSKYGTNSDNTDQESIYLGRNESHVGEFVEGLGPGQLVGRQVLGMPCLGEIQLSFYDRKGHLEVEVIRARGLQQKNTSKPLPAPYVKLHLLEGKQSVEKLRTMYPPRRTLDPLYQQQLSFSMPYHGKILQISVWGEYGRMDKKVFLGMCEIVLDDLDLKTVVFGWYKLFGMIASNAQHHHHHHQHQHQKRQQQQQRKSFSSSSTLLDDSQNTNTTTTTTTHKSIGSKLDKLTNRSSGGGGGNNNNDNTDRTNRKKSKSSQDINRSAQQLHSIK